MRGRIFMFGVCSGWGRLLPLSLSKTLSVFTNSRGANPLDALLGNSFAARCSRARWEGFWHTLIVNRATHLAHPSLTSEHGFHDHRINSFPLSPSKSPTKLLIVSRTTSFGPSTVRSHGLTSWKFRELKNVTSPSTGAITLNRLPCNPVGEYAYEGRGFRNAVSSAAPFHCRS